MSYDVQVVHRVSEIDPAAWDRLNARQAFGSHRWYRFGESVMNDCTPVYILLSRHGEMLARAALWVIRNEPLPVSWLPLRLAMQALLHRWPLLICRSPLANTSGLVLPDPPARDQALQAIVDAALEEAGKRAASFLLFDFLDEAQAGWNVWTPRFSSYSFSDPGTQMTITWSSFDQYLASLSPKARKHYRQRSREAERLGLRVTRHTSVERIEEVLPLIRDVERRHHSAPNPWVRGLLENVDQLGAVWLTASVDGRVVGCELILEDNGTQMITALGLEPGISNVYHLLGYADIRYAIESGASTLRWGSGAYDAKRRFGFSLESNNYVTFCGLSPLSRWMARMASS